MANHVPYIVVVLAPQLSDIRAWIFKSKTEAKLTFFKMRFNLKIPVDREFDSVGFGTNAVDYLITVPEYPQFDSKIRLNDYVQAAGGEIATAMTGLSRLGLRTAYVGRFGDDKEGVYGIQSLKDDGVDVSHVQVIEGARTQIAFIIIDASTGERTVIWERDSRLGYSPEEAPTDLVSKAKALHFTPHDTEAALVLAREARAAGTIVSSDIDNLFPGIQDLLPFIDVMVTSADFPEKLFGISDPETALKEMSARFGCVLTGITLGESGSLIYSGGSFIETSGYAVPGGCKDTTGAGDAFRAGLLYGLLQGEDLETAAKMANAVAALKCRKVGARTALPSANELTEFLASH